MSAAQPNAASLSILSPRPKTRPQSPVPQRSFYALGDLVKGVQATRIVATLRAGTTISVERTRATFQRHPKNPGCILWAVRFNGEHLSEGDATLTVVAYRGPREVAKASCDFKLIFTHPVIPDILVPAANHNITGDDLDCLLCSGEYTAPDDVDLLTLTYQKNGNPHSELAEGVSESDGTWWGLFFDIRSNAPAAQVSGSLVASGGGSPSAARSVLVSPT